MLERNPYKSQRQRLKKALTQIRMAKDNIASMGSTYADHGNADHEEYMKNIYLGLETFEIMISDFAEHM